MARVAMDSETEKAFCEHFISFQNDFLRFFIEIKTGITSFMWGKLNILIMVTKIKATLLNTYCAHRPH